MNTVRAFVEPAQQAELVRWRYFIILHRLVDDGSDVNPSSMCVCRSRGRMVSGVRTAVVVQATGVAV